MLNAVTRIMGQYKRADYENPDVFVEALSALLSRYPLAIVLRAPDPSTGIPGRFKFPPSIAEAKEWCDAAIDRFDAPVEREDKRREMLEALPAPERVTAAERDRREMLLAELRGPDGNWGIKSMDTRPKSVTRMTEKEAEALLKRFEDDLAEGKTGLELHGAPAASPPVEAKEPA